MVTRRRVRRIVVSLLVGLALGCRAQEETPKYHLAATVYRSPYRHSTEEELQHWSCRRRFPEKETLLEKRACCDAILQAWKRPEGTEKGPTAEQCESLLAQVPSTTKETTTTQGRDLLEKKEDSILFFSLLWTSSVEDATRLHKKERDNQRWPWKHYQSERGWWEATREEEGHLSLFSLIENDDDTSSRPPPTLEAHLISRISQEGGMHRNIHHTLTLSRLPPTDDEPFVSSSGVLRLLLFVTSDTFVDSEEETTCIGQQGATCTASLSTHKVINIEQPSFVSPPHVVLIEVQYQATQTTTNNISLHLTTPLHLRYPRPLLQVAYAKVWLPAPMLIHCNVPFRSSHKRELPESDSGCAIATAARPLLEVSVAVPRATDVAWVTWVTLLCYGVGSILMLRDLGRVSQCK